MISNEMADYIVQQCERQYNLDHNDLLTNNKDNGKLKFGWKRSDLKLTVEFSQKKVAEIIYHSFLDDFQREFVTEAKFVEKFNDFMQAVHINSPRDIEKITKRIIKDITSGTLFGSQEKEGLLLDAGERADLKYILDFLGKEVQENKLNQEFKQLHKEVIKFKNSSYQNNKSKVIEKIADCYFLGIQLKENKYVLSVIKGIIEKSNLLDTTDIEQIIKFVKARIENVIAEIERGEHGLLMIGHDPASGKDETVITETKKKKDVAEKKDTGEIKENAMTDEELKAMMNDKEIEDLEDKKRKILLFLSKNTPYEFRPKLLQELVDIKSIECTQIVLQLILERKLIVVKKGQDRIYGASIEYQAGIEIKKTKNTSTIFIGGSGVGIHAKGKGE